MEEVRKTTLNIKKICIETSRNAINRFRKNNILNVFEIFFVIFGTVTPSSIPIFPYPSPTLRFKPADAEHEKNQKKNSKHKNKMLRDI